MIHFISLIIIIICVSRLKPYWQRKWENGDVQK